MNKYLENAEKQLGIKLPALRNSSYISTDAIKSITEEIKTIIKDNKLSKKDFENVSVVILGSMAREERTNNSDCDYIVLQHGAPPEITQKMMIFVEEALYRLCLLKPGERGGFGNVVIAANLYESIGLELDTNVNITQRLLLLTESTPAFGDVVYNEVMDSILSRYCYDYIPPNRGLRSKIKVPRYLLNDLVRYWRTIAVDFGTKRWRTMRDDSYLRFAKLLCSRKTLFAGPLATLLMASERRSTNQSLVNYLKNYLSNPPIAQIASLIKETGNKHTLLNIKKVLENYDSFISYLNKEDFRSILTQNQRSLNKLKIYQEKYLEIGRSIQEGLEYIFNEEDVLKSNFRKYAVF